VKFEPEIEFVIEKVIFFLKNSSLQKNEQFFIADIKDQIYEYSEGLPLPDYIKERTKEIYDIMFNIGFVEFKNPPMTRTVKLTEKGIEFESFEKLRKKEKMTEENFQRQHRQLKNTRIWMIIGWIVTGLLGLLVIYLAHLLNIS